MRTSSSRALRLWLLVALSAVVLLVGAVAAAQPAPPPGPPGPAPSATTPPAASSSAPASNDARIAEAKAHFDLGVAHVDRGEWDAALVEFLKSREIFPTAKNTYNAAICLRKVNRFDEALDMYETLLKDFPNFPERQVAEKEIAELRASIGAIDVKGAVPGAAIVVDGRERGTFPPPAPLRVSAGSHTIRVSKDGYLPFETRVDVAGLQTAVVNVELAALTAAGRLKVSEQTGKALDVVVDNAVVGKTPWEGALAPGDHMVILRGEGNMGTQPANVSVKLNQLITLNLLAEELGAVLRVEPTPATATVSVDGVPLGRGAWEGRLREGTHTVEATAEGYLPFKRDVDLKKDATQVVNATLQRDPSFFAQPSSVIGIELDAALPIGLLTGGDLSDACSGSCSSGLPIGVHGVLHGVYQMGSGFGVGIDAGYLAAWQSITGRQASLLPVGKAANNGAADDKLRLSGLTVGASAQFHKGESWPFLLRLGAGVLLGNMNDSRSGSFTNSAGEVYTVSVKESPGATYLYVAPEARIGRRFGKHFELNVGAEVMLMTALSQPKWGDQTPVLTSNKNSGDGLARFGSQTLAGSFMVLVAPGVGARYEF